MTAVTTPAVTGSRVLPSGWRWATLGEVCEIVAGQSPPGDTYRDEPSGLPFFQGKAEFGALHPIPRVWCVEPNKVAEPDDILISVRAPVGPTNVADTRCCIGRGLAAVRPGTMMDRDYVLFALRHLEADLAALGSGSTFSAISRRELESLPLPIPPLLEQKRIAAALREQLEAAARMGAAAALELEDVNRLERAELRRLFDSREAENWPQCDLRDICVKITDGTHQPPPFTEDGIPFLFVRNIVSGTIDFDTEKHVTQKTLETLTRSWRAERGDILYSAVGSFGVAVVVETDRRFAFQRHIALLKLQLDVADPWFLSFYLNSPGGKAQSEARALGGGQRTVTLGSLGGFRVPRPPLDIQRGVAARLHSRLADVAETRARFESQAAEIGRLSAALLRRAFSGGL